MSKARRDGIASRAVRGAIAGAVGTAAMDLLLHRRYRRGGGTDPFWRWELAADVQTWADASAPGQVGRKVAVALTGQEPPDRWARTTTNVVHWATGVGWAAQFGVLAGDRVARRPWLGALVFGPAVWLSGYVLLPLAGVYRPIWEYDAKTLADDLGAHLVFGAATGATLALLTRPGKV